MRPRSVIRPRVSSVSVNVVAMRPRAHVAARILGLSAERADGPARLDERARALDERRRLDAADLEARRRRLLPLGLLPELLVGDDHDAVLPLVVSQDRKSTRLNSSHSQISYAVFCLKKK